MFFIIYPHKCHRINWRKSPASSRHAIFEARSGSSSVYLAPPSSERKLGARDAWLLIYYAQELHCHTLTKGSNWQITPDLRWGVFTCRSDLASSTSIPSFEQKHSSCWKIFKSRYNDIALTSMYMYDRHILLIYEKISFSRMASFCQSMAGMDSMTLRDGKYDTTDETCCRRSASLKAPIILRRQMGGSHWKVYPLRTKTTLYLFLIGNKSLLYHQIGHRNFFIFTTIQWNLMFCVDKIKYEHLAILSI